MDHAQSKLGEEPGQSPARRREPGEWGIADSRPRAQLSKEKYDRITELLRGSAQLWQDQRSSKELMDEIYDEHGLPS